MFKITKKEYLTPIIVRMDIEAPRVAKSAKPGQFVILKLDERGERIPLTICDYDKAKGTVTIVFQVVGKSTTLMEKYQEGDMFMDFVGPLGMPSEFVAESVEHLRKKKILFVAGGVGTAPVYPQVKWFHEQGADVDVIIGSKNSGTVILYEEMKAVAGNVFLCTDDGSAGEKGFVTDRLKSLVEVEGRHYDHVVAIGPMIMMKFISLLTKQLNIPTTVSLNTLMVCGMGMCGACRVTVGEETKFTCVDGPEFDGHLVNFEEAMRRQLMYKDQEK